MAYNYDPAAVAEYGKDRMRFELGDTMVEGGPDTTALPDEEIEAALSAYPKAGKRAKLMLLESLFRRFSYEVDTKTGPLTLSLQARKRSPSVPYPLSSHQNAARSLRTSMLA